MTACGIQTFFLYLRTRRRISTEVLLVSFYLYVFMGYTARFFLIIFVSVFCSQLSGQMKMKDYSRIMQSTSIYEIDAYLRDAHPDDPKRLILKPRLVTLLQEYIKEAHPADQRIATFQEKLVLLRTRKSTKLSFDEMNDMIRKKKIAKYQAQLEAETAAEGLGGTAPVRAYSVASSGMMDDAEQEEFRMLMEVSPIEHKNRTVQILNSLFDNDPSSKESIVMIENKSDCNMIMRLEGVGNYKYRLAIPSGAESAIVVQKGNYLFSSKVCGADYASQKAVQNAVIIALSNPPK